MKTLITITLLTMAAAAGNTTQSSIVNRPSSIQPPSPPAKWQNPGEWRSIKPGITPSRAAQYLGDPAETRQSETLDVWYYRPNGSLSPEQKVPVGHPKDAVLIFHKSPSGQTLQKIIPPDWQTIPAWADLQAEYRRAVTDYNRQIAEQKRLAAQEAAQQRAQARAAEIAKREQALKNPKPSQQVTIHHSTSQNNPARKPKPDVFASLGHSLVYAGIALIIFSITVIVIMGQKYFTS